MSIYLALCVVLATTIGAHGGGAAVNLIRDYRLKPSRDRHIVLAMAITPNQDLLSLIANKEGQWRFSRVQGWLEKEPHEDIRSATALLRQRDILRLLWPVSRSET